MNEKRCKVFVIGYNCEGKFSIKGTICGYAPAIYPTRTEGYLIDFGKKMNPRIIRVPLEYITCVPRPNDKIIGEWENV